MKPIPPFVCPLLITALAALHCLNEKVSAANFPWGWCTYQAEVEFNRVAPSPKVNWSGNAGTWLANASNAGWVTKTGPREVESGAIIVWTQSGGMGHVGFVTSVSSTGFSIREMNIGTQVPGAEVGKTTGFGIISSRSFTFSAGLNRQVNLQFAGYVLPRRKTGFMSLSQIDAIALTDMRRATSSNSRFNSGSWSGPFYMPADATYLYRNAQVRFGATGLWQQGYVQWAISWQDPTIRFTFYRDGYTGIASGWVQVPR